MIIIERLKTMSDYQDLCEMYGTDASDPDFIDQMIEEFGDDGEEDGEWLELNPEYADEYDHED